MLCPPHPPAPVVQDWIERHRHPVSFLLHMVGIPPTLVGVLLAPVSIALLSPTLMLFSLSLFVGGYLIQFLGHLAEGSEPGEITHLRHWLLHRLPRRRSRREPEGR
jgi:uncharacterized membrane protein YGL010W